MDNPKAPTTCRQKKVVTCVPVSFIFILFLLHSSQVSSRKSRSICIYEHKRGDAAVRVSGERQVQTSGELVSAATHDQLGGVAARGELGGTAARASPDAQRGGLCRHRGELRAAMRQGVPQSEPTMP